MRWDRILATLLIVASFAAAIAVWWERPDRRGGGREAGGGGAQIAIIDVYGVIADQAPAEIFGGQSASPDRLIKAIRRAERDGVKAILLRINSPGGTAAASQAIYQELMRVRKDTKIRIVASMGDVAASGGYYVAAAAHHIMALPATTTGSIGVIMRLQNLERLMDKIGVRQTTIQSGPRKDILSPFRQASPEERAILQDQVNETYQQFLDAILAGRPVLSLAELKPLADGRIFTGSGAMRVELVDSLGNYREAIRFAAEQTGIKGDPRVENYTEQGIWESLVPRLESKLEGLLGPAAWVRWNRVPLALME